MILHPKNKVPTLANRTPFTEHFKESFKQQLSCFNVKKDMNRTLQSTTENENTTTHTHHIIIRSQNYMLEPDRGDTRQGA